MAMTGAEVNRALGLSHGACHMVEKYAIRKLWRQARRLKVKFDEQERGSGDPMGEKAIANNFINEAPPAAGSEVHGFDQRGGVHILLVVASVKAPARWALARCTLHHDADGEWGINYESVWTNARFGRLIPAGAI
jgi:hypothetical protein